MKLKWITLLAWMAFANSLFAQNSADVTAYINTYKEIAIAEMQRTGIPAAITLAQGIHETEAGTSDLVRKSNNHFGIKCKDNWTGSVVYHDDDARGECFRSYNSPNDSYKDHSDFLLGSARYQSLFRLDPEDYEGWAYGLKKAGYATNVKYPQILIKLIRDYNLEQYTLIAMGKLPPAREALSDMNAQANKLVVAQPPVVYPDGVFSINNTRVVFAHSGSSLLTLADQYQVPLARLIDFNDLRGEEILVNDQLIFLQRKRKLGANEFHLVKPGETLYGICQQEGIRFESVLSFNQLVRGEEPAPGEKIYLQSAAPAKPLLFNKMIQASDSTQDKEKNVQSISGPITHVVQIKETLYSISKKYSVDVEKIQQWNRLDSAGLKTGQELIIYKN